jgi:glycosyltransferase involved in cell wall biosynthesis
VDAAAVAEALCDLLGSADLEAMASAARGHAEQHFSTDRLVADHRDLYRRLVGR